MIKTDFNELDSEPCTMIEDVAKLVAEQYDNEVAKAFTLQIYELLKDNGIEVILSQKESIDIQAVDDFKAFFNRRIALQFSDLNTKEHDDKIREDERRKFLTWLEGYKMGDELCIYPYDRAKVIEMYEKEQK